MRKGFLTCTKKVLVSYLIILAIVAYFYSGQAEAANGNEAKVTSPGGYTGLLSKSQSKGTVKIIVRARAPFIPESLLQETDKNAQRVSRLHIQDQIITELESKGHKPRRIHKYKYSPYIAMTVDSTTLEALLLSQDVISIEEDIPVPPTLDQSVPRIGAAELHESNVTGAGVAVAILDTGVDKTHPFLLGSVVSEACYSSNYPADGIFSLCPGGVGESEAVGSAMPYGGNCPATKCDHGTHVAGIVAGRSRIPLSPGPGVAPEAGIIAIQIFSRFNSYEDCDGQAPCVMSYPSDQMKGLERVQDLGDTRTIASVNMSLGGRAYSDYCDNEFPAMRDVIKNLRDAEIATVIASGNDGYCGAISTPACISSAISVGATDDDDAVAYYSNSASFLSLLAPGSSILSSLPGGGYNSWNGTSMATPHVVGAWALMKQAYPAATVDEILSSFTSTGPRITDQGCTSVTKKRINVYEAYGLMGDYASLTVSKTGIGTGNVTSNPSGITCGEDCGQFFAKDTFVTLSAIADSGTEFAGWSGAGCSGTGECAIALSATSSVTASFLKEITIGSEVIITGSDFGTKKGKVMIGDVTAKIAKDDWSKNAITLTVTKIPSGSPSVFSISVLSKSAGIIPFHNACTVKAPEIVTLSTGHGMAGTSITVKGKFFSTKKPKVYIRYTDKNGLTKMKACKVTPYPLEFMNKTTGESRLTFVVPKLPEGFVQGSETLMVVNKVGTATIPFTVDI